MDGDAGFAAVIDRIAPELLAPGGLAYGINVELVSGETRTRRGAVTPGWGTIGSGTAGELMRGAAVYRTPGTTGDQVIVFGTEHLYVCTPGHAPRAIALPGGQGDEDDAGIQAVQAFGKLLMFRKRRDGASTTEGLVPWEFNGSVVAEMDRSILTDGTRPIPLTSRGELVGDRLFVLDPEDVDAVQISDIAEPGRYVLGNRQRFEPGSGDAVGRVYAWTRDTVLVFKGKSIHALVGASGNLAEISIERVKAPAGLLAPESVCTDGQGVFYLASGGVYRIEQVAVVQQRFAVDPVAVSDPVSTRLFARVNWAAATKAQGIVLQDYFYLAVPLDRETRCNAVLVYHLPSKSWIGAHVYPSTWKLDRLLVMQLNGRDRLVAVDYGSSDGTTPAAVRVLYEGGHEDLGGTWTLGDVNDVEVDEPNLEAQFAPNAARWAKPRVGDTVFTAELLADEEYEGGMPVVTAVPAVNQVVVSPGDAPIHELQTLLLGQAPQPIGTEVWSRAYTAQQPGRKRWRQLRVATRERGASYTVKLATDGNREDVELAPAPVTRDRTKNLDGTSWNTTNAGDDHGEAGREDYAVVCPFQCGTGIVLSREQEYEDPFLAQVRGRTAQCRIVSTRGLLAVQAITAEGTAIDRHLAVTQ